MKKEAVQKKDARVETQFPTVSYNPSLDKYEGRTISPEKMVAIKKSLEKPGFPGITAPETRFKADKLQSA